VQKWLLADNYSRALAAAADYRDIFGKENFFVELMDHNLDIEKKTRDGLLRIAKELDIPLVATNDLHYVRAEDAKAHDALLCIQTGSRLSDVKRFKFDSQEFYVKSAAQMRAIFKDVPEACDNTLLIAERCNVKFTEGQDLLPRFPVPAGMTQDDLLALDVKAGLEGRFKELGKEVPASYYERADYELGVEKNMGFPGYFLVVADLVRYAKENGIRVGPGRGSAAGALIAWALGITELDPIFHGLLFERFLNPERVSMPDFDIDFCQLNRDRVIDYVKTQYGREGWWSGPWGSQRELTIEGSAWTRRRWSGLGAEVGRR
jgi:DNA polymerase-3 subunit alpha